MKYFTIFGQSYGEDTYGSCDYVADGQASSHNCTVAAAGTGAADSTGGLADTGISIVAVLTLACLLIFIALIVRLWRRKQRPAFQGVAAQEDTTVQERRKRFES